MYVHTFVSEKQSQMKTIAILTAAGLATILSAFGPYHQIKTLKVKPEASKIEWVGKKVTGQHNGTVQVKSGTVEIENNTLTAGHFEVDMTSIVCLDLEGEYKGKLESHLKSADFFDVEKHKTATLKIKKVTELPGVEGFNSQVTADLTIKGITHEVQFPAKIEIKDDKLAAYGEITIDRSKFDVRYGSPSFFDDLGDKAIYDEFQLKVSLGAKA